jgi:hypothetical protein
MELKRISINAPDGDAAKTKKNRPHFVSNRRVSGMSMPQVLASNDVSYSFSPMSSGSPEAWNLTSHSFPSAHRNAFGRAPPEEPL